MDRKHGTKMCYWGKRFLSRGFEFWGVSGAFERMALPLPVDVDAKCAQMAE